MSDVARALMQAPHGLKKLKTLVRLSVKALTCPARSCKGLRCPSHPVAGSESWQRVLNATCFLRECWVKSLNALVMHQELHVNDYANILQDRHAWVQMLLFGATGLTALSVSTNTLPRSPIVQHLPLRHLEIFVLLFSGKNVERCFADISRCLTLETLKISGNMTAAEPDFVGPPSIQLHSMPRLKHVRLDRYTDVGALSLPGACSLFVNIDLEYFGWREQWEKFQSYLSVLRFTTYGKKWPPGIQGFSNLNFFQYRTEKLRTQDLADLQHIPHVKVVSLHRERARRRRKVKLQLTSGSWQSLEVFFFGCLSLTIANVDSFVKGTGIFTFSSEDTHGVATGVFQEIQEACSRHGKACHLSTHKGAPYGGQRTYVTLSTSKHVAMNCPVIYGKDHEKDPAVDFERSLCSSDDYWPCDPFAPVK